MPKIRSHSGTGKRTRFTKGGKKGKKGAKILFEHAFNNHFRTKKSAARKRSLAGKAEITGGAAKNIKQALGA